MTLKEYIIISKEEYLEEGLKLFKKSKQLSKHSETLLNKSEVMEDGPEKEKIRKLSKKMKKLSDNYSAIEDAFATKDIDRTVAKNKIKELQNNGKKLLDDLKSDQTKKALSIGKSVATGLVIRLLLNKLISGVRGLL